MDLKTGLRFDGVGSVAFVGSGGKTTALFQLARELDPPVLITASTHLAVHQTVLADKHIIIKHPAEIQRFPDGFDPGVTLITGPIDGDRTSGLNDVDLAKLAETCRGKSIPVLIEADGSRNYPLKSPADYEPAIPTIVDMVVVVAGLSGLGQSIEPPWVHRPERFAEISGEQVGGRITPDAIVQVLSHPRGGMKNIPPGSRRVILLNQADTPSTRIMASSMAQSLLRNVQGVLVAALNPQSNDSTGLQTSEQTRYIEVHEPVAGIILAAGSASRYGEVKQLLEWGGKPLVWHAANRAVQAGLSPVIVVCGDAIVPIQKALTGLPVQVVHNPDWAKGQGTSVRVGVQTLSASVGGGVFMLADQPQIPVELLRLLVVKHSQTLSPIIAPCVGDRRGNPVLFDRELFPVLATLTGDVGGRSLFDQYEVTLVYWDDPDILWDVDLPEDYNQLVTVNPWLE